MRTRLAVSLFSFAMAAFGQAEDVPAYRNPALPAGKRAEDLVSRMTLDEKVLQMQNSAPAIPRLGIPAYDWWNEALHGVARAGLATVFPQAIGLAATWDTGLMHRVANVISTEARAKYHEAIRHDDHRRYRGLTFWSPNINIFRDPRWGRGQETYGEDPFLTGRMAVAFITGMQGDDPRYFKTIATAKHYAVHSGPESSRHSFDARPSSRDLNETYLPAFRASILEGKADSVMCAYNRVDGVPACASTDLLEKRLRGEWGFQGYVVSDCGAISDIFRGHKYKPTAMEASAVAVKAGTDLTCGNEYRSLVDAVKAGHITEKEIDRSLERLFEARFRLGMFDSPERVPFAKIPYSVTDSPEHRKVALEAARKSIVLLKNENALLPVKDTVRRIAVIGPAADDPEALLGNYNGYSSKHVTALEGVERRFTANAEIRFSPGATYTAQTPGLPPTAVWTTPEGAERGVLAEYFDNAEFQGEPKLRRVEPRPYSQPIADAALAAAFPKDDYSLRWTGTLRPTVTGNYVLAPLGGRARIFLDDSELTSSTPSGRNRSPRFEAAFEAGHAYRLRLEIRPQRIADGGPQPQLAWIPPAEPLLAEAVALAKDSDLILAFAGLTASLEGEQLQLSIPGFFGGDRTDIKLPEPQERLIEAAAATGKPVVVVLTSGSAVAVNYAAEHAGAVLAAWYGGEEAGTAIADTLAGDNNPAGRLPVTFYRGVDQLPAFDDYAMTGRTYRYFTGNPLYGFGFGLSYSRFAYSGLSAERTSKGGRVRVTVKNESPRDGEEVVQLYVSGGGAAGDPVRELRGFERVRLAGGESRSVEFAVPPESLPPGKARVSVGGGQPGAGTAFVEGVL